MSARVGFGGGNKEVKEITENRDEGPVLNDREPLGSPAAFEAYI